MKEKRSEFRINGKNAVSVRNVDELKGHRGSTVYGILSTAGRTEPAVAAKRRKFESATRGTAIHDATKRRVATVNHPVDIFND